MDWRGPRVMGTRTVYRNPWMSVREDSILGPDGTPGIYGVVDKTDYALVIPVENGGFHLVEQYRYPVGGRYWEFPQGSWPAGDGHAEGRDTDPLLLAAAELREETGLRAATMTYLGRLHVAYGYSSQGCHVFVADDLVAGQAAREPTEYDMRQRWVNRSEWTDMVCDGAITDAATLGAFTLYCMSR